MCTAAQFAEILSFLPSFAHAFHCEKGRTIHPPVAENSSSMVQGCSWLCARPTRWLHGTFGLENTGKKNTRWLCGKALLVPGHVGGGGVHPFSIEVHGDGWCLVVWCAFMFVPFCRMWGVLGIRLLCMALHLV